MRKLINSLAALLFILNLLAHSARTAPAPNIVLIVSDDQGYNDLGCFDSTEALTPNLDRLARGGVRLTSFYVAWPACTPSRGSLLTGRYPQRNGIYDMIRNEAPDFGYRYPADEYAVTFEHIGGMDTREVLLPQILANQGYATGIFGKWDLGQLRRYLPLQRGFDTFYGFCNTGIDYFTHERYGVPSMFRGNQPTIEDRGTYCTDLFEREALDFLRQNHQRPFLLYLPFNAPHGASNLDPLIRSSAQAPEWAKKLYPKLQSEAKVIPGARYGQPADRWNAAGRRLEYLAAVSAMDAAIGKVLNALEDYNVANNTLVFFLSDNGGSGGSDNGQLRAGKASLFEGGVRVPAIARLPGRIPAGTANDAFLTTLEVLPTMANLCGAKIPAEIELDGFDMLPAISSNADAPRKSMFWKRQNDRAVRSGEWKWVDSRKGTGLFNLANDVSERTDLSQQHLHKLQELKDAFAAWEAKMQAAEPRGPFRDY